MDIVMEEHKPSIMIPKECVDPTKYKPGDDFEYTVKGRVVSSNERHGVEVELSHEEGEENESMEGMSDDERKNKVKKAFDKSSKVLEEYR